MKLAQQMQGQAEWHLAVGATGTKGPFAYVLRPRGVAYLGTQQHACRHQWYQTQQMVEVAVLAKGLPPERVSVDIQENQLRITTMDEAGKQDYEFKADLFGKVWSV